MTGSADGAADSLIGKIVADRYLVEAHMGEGGMGSVYRARHVTLEKLVALKVLHAEFSRKEDFVRRFLLEAKAASRIRNQHVIDITDFGTTDEGYVFFAMEFLAGKDLHGLLRETLSEGELVPWERAKGIFLQICEALTAAHEKGIIHRDLKPENIFLVEGTRQEDFVKLLDFGIAKVEQGESEEGERKLTKTGMLFGTPEYMAPEQARGEKPDHRVDVYAMGCLLFQFITGTVPFQGESFMAILTQHMIEDVPEISPELLLRTGAPQGILPVIAKALVKDRDQRYETITALATAVANAGQANTVVDTVQANTVAEAPLARTQSSAEATGETRDAISPAGTIALPAVSPPSKAKFLYAGIAALLIGGGVLGVIAMSGDSTTSTEATDVVETGEGETPTQVTDPSATDIAAAKATDPVEVKLAPVDSTPDAGAASIVKADDADPPDKSKPADNTTGKKPKRNTDSKVVRDTGKSKVKPDRKPKDATDSKGKGDDSKVELGKVKLKPGGFPGD